jgi:hypothetical protein
MPIAKTAGMLTGANPSCGSLAEWPVRRAGKHKTLYIMVCLPQCCDFIR